MLVPEDDRLSLEKSRPGRKGATLPFERFFSDRPADAVPEQLLRKRPLLFPEMSEPEIVRHFVNLSKKNFCIDSHFYPLGSCTMKYNPKVNEWASYREGFAQLHPLVNDHFAQGFLRILHDLSVDLSEITGMDEVTLQPAAGAHGELTGMMIVHAYHESRKDAKRRKVLVPDSSHGTNPATAAFLGYRVVELKSNSKGRVDLESLDAALDEETACLMLTNPNTLGLFEDDILTIAKKVHEKGALLYYDGANLNALLGLARPGDMGFDIVHLNLHKTFSTPHGGGGPGSGPVGVKKYLKNFLPVPFVVKEGEEYKFSSDRSSSIGRVKSFHGNAGMLLRAYIYIKTLGREGLKKMSEDAILNANYLKEKLKSLFTVAVDEPCMHEFVLSMKQSKAKGIHSGDIGKRLLDFGFHAPTVHFPLVVEEAFMVEPTESESLETLDLFVQAMKKIAWELANDPEKIQKAPHTLPIKRPDEVLAARKPILTFRDYERERILLAEGTPVS